MSMYDYVDDTVRLDNGLIVQRYSILTTPIVMHVVYEPATNYPNRTHSTITWIDGQPFGSYCSAELPAEIEALAGRNGGLVAEAQRRSCRDHRPGIPLHGRAEARHDGAHRDDP